MRRAVSLEAVRDYLERQMATIEPDYQCERSQAEHAPDWPALWTRRTWLYWLEKKALRRAERAVVGAVLGEDLDEALLETLGLLGEQLHEQQTEWTDASGLRRGGGVVSRDLTQNAVAPFWSSPTAISASAEGWRRRFESIERRLWRLERDLGGARAIPGYEAAHRHAGDAACHYAAYRQLETWSSTEAAGRLMQAGQALEQALAAYQSPSVPRDRIADELASLRNTLSIKNEEGS